MAETDTQGLLELLRIKIGRMAQLMRAQRGMVGRSPLCGRAGRIVEGKTTHAEVGGNLPAEWEASGAGDN